MDPVRSRVLVVDDEPTVRQLVRRVLGQGCDLIEAADGAEALEIAVAQKPDLILMDLMMPNMDGLSACCALKQNTATRDIPVVMLTAITHELNRKLAEKAAGVDAYVTKPFDSHELLVTVTGLLAEGSRTS